MTLRGRIPGRVGLWFLVGTLLLVWNGWLSTLASPFVLNHRLDGVQFQLLARNRLRGHYEIGDEAQTVHREGRHPMWRPGLVWIEEGLARCLGAVRNGAAAASALGAALLEMVLLCLAWRCFGQKTSVCVLIGLAVPAVASPFLELAVGQGPEVWSSAMIMAGLVVLVEACRRQSAWCALASGMIAGMGEWFRTGNVLLFAIPCAVYSASAVSRTRWHTSTTPCTPRSQDESTVGGESMAASAAARNWRGFCLPAWALLAWAGMAALVELAAPSAVNKTIANLWACRDDLGGPLITEELADGTTLSSCLIGYTLVPETAEVYVDSVIRRSRGCSTLEYCHEYAGEIGRAYVQRVQQVLTSGFRGLRQRVGNFVLVLFSVQLLLGLARYDHLASDTFALAGAALGHYFGPVVLVAGNEPTHYVLVAYPLFVLVAALGAEQLAAFVCRAFAANQSMKRPGLIVGLFLLMLAFPGVLFYHEAGTRLRDLKQQALQQQADVDALGLEGTTVACRNMAWFVDRDVQTVFLPYATVPELERYVSAHGIDGILVWEQEAMAAFCATPYGSLTEFGQALQASAVFGPPHISGGWRWYPVRRRQSSEEQP